MAWEIKKPNNNTSYYIIYETLMIIVSLLIVLFSLVDLFLNFSEATILIVLKIDYLICMLFGLDLMISLHKAENKLRCLKSSLITIIAIVPFSTFFRIAGVLRVTHLFSIFRYTTPLHLGVFTGIFSFIMKPSVIRMIKFSNMARTYHYNQESKKNRTSNTIVKR